MTLPIRVKQKCCICGHVSNQTVLASTNRFGSPDLDLRPPEMMRSTMGWWVHECPRCGYVSADLSEKATGNEISERDMRKFLRSDEYVSCDGIGFKSDLAKKFFRCFLIHAHAGKWEEAFGDVHHAAWACDDADDKENAVICRKRAIRCSSHFQLTDTEKAIIADLMRRAGLFEQVIREYEDVRTNDEIIDQVIRFQVRKAKERDVKCYTLDDIGLKD